MNTSMSVADLAKEVKRLGASEMLVQFKPGCLLVRVVAPGPNGEKVSIIRLDAQ